MMATMDAIIHTAKGAKKKTLGDSSNDTNVHGTQPSPKKPSKAPLSGSGYGGLFGAKGTATGKHATAAGNAAATGTSGQAGNGVMDSGIPTWAYVAGAAALIYWYTSR